MLAGAARIVDKVLIFVDCKETLCLKVYFRSKITKLQY